MTVVSSACRRQRHGKCQDCGCECHRPLELDVRWMRRAACRGADPEMFYPERGDNYAVRDAKALCWTCPVQAECLNHALLTREKWGVFGGYSEGERRRLRADPAARAIAFLRIDHRDAG